MARCLQKLEKAVTEYCRVGKGVLASGPHRDNFALRWLGTLPLCPPYGYLKPRPKSAFHPVQHNRHHGVPIKFDLDDRIARFFRALKIVELLVDRGFRAYGTPKLDAIGRVLPDIKKALAGSVTIHDLGLAVGPQILRKTFSRPCALKRPISSAEILSA